MDILNQLTNICNYPNIAVALGTFDGVHIGHQHIIGNAVELARKSAGTSVVFTFSNHPLHIIAPDRCPPLLLTEKGKAAIMAELGVDILLSLPFTAEFLQLTPAQFMDLLVTNLCPSYIVVGPNYTFGHKGAGTPEMLRKAGRAHCFEVVVPQAVTIHDRLASSTLIRQLVLAGKVEEAAVYLGRPFSLSGRVVHGEKRGRQLGYPTANIQLPEGMAVPADGVYAVIIQHKNKRWNGVANIGCNPTFHGKQRRLEVFILDFDGDLYHKELDVSFRSRIREEIRFPDSESLKAQLRRDIQMARTVLA